MDRPRQGHKHRACLVVALVSLELPAHAEREGHARILDNFGAVVLTQRNELLAHFLIRRPLRVDQQRHVLPCLGCVHRLLVDGCNLPLLLAMSGLLELRRG